MLFLDFKQFMLKKWSEIAAKSKEYKIVVIYKDRIEEIE